MLVSQMSDKINYLKYYRPVPNIKGTRLEDIIRWNFRVVPFAQWLRITNPKVLHKKLILQDYDVEISFFGAELIRVISGCRNTSTKKICWFHSEKIEGIFNVIKSDRQKKKIFGKIDKIICVSDVVRRNVKKELPWHENIITLWNPNNTNHIRKCAEETKGIPHKNKFTFVMVCRLSMETKGLDRMIECVKKLEREFDFEVWVVGDGNDKE